MITVSVDGEPKAVIATPTKCGTTTLEAVARRHMRRAEQIEGVDEGWLRLMDWDSPRRQHRMALPPNRDGEKWEKAARFLVVRNPFRRYMSMYEYLRAPQNYSQWGARWVQGEEWPGAADGPWLQQKPMGFDEFLGFIAQNRLEDTAERDMSVGSAYRSPWVWTDPLTWSRAALAAQGGPGKGKRVRLVRLEQLWEDLAALLRGCGVPVAADKWDSGVLLSRVQSNRTVRPFLGRPAEEWEVLGCKSQNPYSSSGEWVGFDGWDGEDCGCNACAVLLPYECLEMGY